ncbi:hypothetical protein AB0B39_03290 [Micromonospora sp. NPDC049114]|uniref:hypothetical protein n=1 Tax=Micromonospora sp. NPDC049114 TaxID=3155498 RepID=UPI0033C76C15
MVEASATSGLAQLASTTQQQTLTSIWTGPALTLVGSILTAASLLIAALTYRHGRKEARRSQALAVAAWVEPAEEPVEALRLVVKNGSELPVYEVVIHCHGVINSVAYDVIPPESERVYVKPLGEIQIRRLLEGFGLVGNYRPPQPSVRFRDTSGRRWSRLEDGTLKRCSWEAHMNDWIKACAWQRRSIAEQLKSRDVIKQQPAEDSAST